MQGRTKWLKFAAFVPAIVLVGGFIGYRAGAFELPWASKPAPQPEAQPATASEQPPTPQLTPPSATPEGNPTFMAGSKSFILTPHVPLITTPANTPPTSEQPPAILYSSKSAPIFIPPPNPGAQQGVPITPPNTPKR
jgi:hypothetical protein